MAFLQGVGSAYYKGECGYQQRWRYSDNPELRLEVDGSATSYLHPVAGRYLNLENMNLTELPAGVFDGLEYLRGLYLQGNKLRTLPEGLFRNLGSLEQLDLSNNGLEVVEKRSFQGLTKLTQIDLSNNRLSWLPNGIFKDVGNDPCLYCTVTLRLQGNMLSTLDRAFDGFMMLERLYLQDNKLYSFLPGALKGLKHLGHLDLSNNSLTTLDEHIFDSLESLRILNMAWNQLGTLPEGLFRNLSGLRYLYLQNNGLEELPSSVCARNHVDLIFCFFLWITSLPLLLN